MNTFSAVTPGPEAAAFTMFGATQDPRIRNTQARKVGHRPQNFVCGAG